MSDNMSVNNPIIPVNTNQPLDIRTLVNSYSDIANIPNPYIGMTITVKSDETNNGNMTDYKVKSLKSNELGMNNTVIDEIERLDEYIGMNEIKSQLDKIISLKLLMDIDNTSYKKDDILSIDKITRLQNIYIWLNF